MACRGKYASWSETCSRPGLWTEVGVAAIATSYMGNVSKPVTLSGNDGDDAKLYQEKAVRLAIEESRK